MSQPNRQPATENRPAAPQWVKALALAAVVVLAVIVLVLLLAGGEHGPGRHGGWVDSVGSASTVRDS